MVATAIRLGMGALLVGSALLKLASPRSSVAALSTFGFADARLRWVAWGSLICAELVLGAGVCSGSDQAAYLAAALMALFGLLLVGALMRGRAGAPCACFGSRSRVSRIGVLRNLAMAAGYAALPLLPEESLSTEQWLGLGLAAALLASAGLTVAVLALAREVGMLRLRMGPAAALEIPGEGPLLGGDAGLADRFSAAVPPGGLLLAVFLSEGCHVCRGLEPAIEGLAADPVVSVLVFDEVADAEVWRRLEIPGSPYAAALDLDGTVLAKGSFNNLAQLEGVLATAERRRAAEEPIPDRPHA
jgi:hypothetical protein